MSYSHSNLSQADWFFGTKPSAAAQAMDPNQPITTPASVEESVAITEQVSAQAPTTEAPAEELTQGGKLIKYAVIGVGGLFALLLLRKILKGRNQPQVIIQQVPAPSQKKRRKK